MGLTEAKPTVWPAPLLPPHTCETRPAWNFWKDKLHCVKGEVERLLCGPTWLAWEETVFVNAEVGKAWG